MIGNFSSSKQDQIPTEKTDRGPMDILLHSCCAPCSGAIIERLIKEGFRPHILFYNPNIFPQKEYKLRKASLMIFCARKGIACTDLDYDHTAWLEQVKGLEHEPERGQRCTVCFDIRLGRAARYAAENGFKTFATTNGIGRWKDMDQVNTSGLKAAARYPGLRFWARNWREKNALLEGQAIAKQEHFYKQLYCGCEFSQEEANRQRRLKGLSPLPEQGTSF